MTDAEERPVCIPNIGPAERRKRVAGGYLGAAVALLVLAWLVGTHAALGWRLLLFPLFAGAFVGFFQAYEKT